MDLKKCGLLILGTAFGVALAGCGNQSDAEKAALNAPPVAAPVGTIAYVDTPEIVEATGSVRARLNSVLASKVTARVAAVDVKEGDHVRAGQTLVVLDSRELRSAVQIASANVRAADVGVGASETAYGMEVQTSMARIIQAQAQLAQMRASLAVAQSKLDLALAGPRQQEREQAKLAVAQAEAALTLAKKELDRQKQLFEAGAVAKRDYDVAESAYDSAKAQRDSAVQANRMAIEGSRQQDIQAARDAVRQAKAAVSEAQAGVKQAQAAALQADVRKQEIQSAKAQANQAGAALQSAQVSLAYGATPAPFDGVVTKRYVDPGALSTVGTPLVAIEGGGLRLEAIVPESALPHISIGAEPELSLDALGDTPLHGKVVEIVPQGDSTSHTFLVRVSLPSDGRVKSGMFGRARFVVGRRKTITIPTSCTWEREGLRYVFAVNSDHLARLRLITVGEKLGDRFEVLTGLMPGDRIVLDDIDKVADGVKVEAR